VKDIRLSSHMSFSCMERLSERENERKRRRVLGVRAVRQYACVPVPVPLVCVRV
jgi:hypothetical protein